MIWLVGDANLTATSLFYQHVAGGRHFFEPCQKWNKYLVITRNILLSDILSEHFLCYAYQIYAKAVHEP